MEMIVEWRVILCVWVSCTALVDAVMMVLCWYYWFCHHCCCYYYCWERWEIVFVVAPVTMAASRTKWMQKELIFCAVCKRHMSNFLRKYCCSEVAMSVESSSCALSVQMHLLTAAAQKTTPLSLWRTASSYLSAASLPAIGNFALHSTESLFR